MLKGVVQFGIASIDSNFSFDTSTIPDGIKESNTQESESESESPITMSWQKMSNFVNDRPIQSGTNSDNHIWS